MPADTDRQRVCIASVAFFCVFRLKRERDVLSGRESLDYKAVAYSARHNMYTLTIRQIHWAANRGKFNIRFDWENFGPNHPKLPPQFGTP